MTRPRLPTFAPGFLLAASAASLLAGACGGTPNNGTGSGGQTASGGSSAVGGGSTGGAANTGGGPSGGSSSGGSSSGGAGGTAAGGSSSGGSATGGSASGGTGGGGGSDECTRELLDGTLDAYFDALSAHDASTLSLASTVKFTENAEESEIGEAGLWLTAGEVEYSQRMLDVEHCTAAAHAVLTADGDDYALAIRIKLDGLEITEVETIAVPPGTFTSVTANPSAIVAIADEVGWPEVVPEAERATHDEMVAWLEKYFSFFPQGVCNVSGECTRLENGGGSFSCGTGATCMAGDPGPSDNNLPSREIHADPETGVGIGMTVYSDNIDMHMFKMVDGEVLAVQAIFFPTNGATGWD